MRLTTSGGYSRPSFIAGSRLPQGLWTLANPAGEPRTRDSRPHDVAYRCGCRPMAAFVAVSGGPESN